MNDPVPVSVNSDVFLCLSLITTSDDMEFVGVDRLMVFQDDTGFQMKFINNDHNNAETVLKIDDNSQSIKNQTHLMSEGLFETAIGKRVSVGNGICEIVLRIQKGFVGGVSEV
jgi:hypothetical protein